MGLNPVLSHFGAMWWRGVLLKTPRCTTKLLTCPGKQFSFQNFQMKGWLLSFTPEGTKKNKWRSPSGCDCRPHHHRKVTISTPLMDPLIPLYSKLIVLVVEALLNVKFLLICEHQNGHRSIFHEIQNLLTSVKSHRFMSGWKLPFLHLVRIGSKDFFEDSTHWSLTASCCCNHFCSRTWNHSQLLFFIFHQMLHLDHSFSALAWLVACFTSFLELFNNLPNSFTVNMQLFSSAWVSGVRSLQMIYGMQWYASNHNDSYQKGLGTCYALFSVSHTLQSALETKQEARIVQIDFNAAFDTVNHQGILNKLCSLSIGGSVLSIFTQFLSNWSQHIMVDSCQSPKNINVLIFFLSIKLIAHGVNLS